MGTISDKLNLLLNTKNAIQAAITGKGQPVAGSDPFSSYPGKIAAIQTGVDTSDATATAAAIRSGLTAYAKGVKLTGTLADAVQATPGISVSSAGLITASAAQEAGYVAAGTRAATRQLDTQAAAAITPGRVSQTAVAAGRYTTGAVTVAGDANLLNYNIAKGKTIFGVAGAAPVWNTAYISYDVTSIQGGILTLSSDDETLGSGRLVEDVKLVGVILSRYVPVSENCNFDGVILFAWLTWDGWWSGFQLHDTGGYKYVDGETANSPIVTVEGSDLYYYFDSTGLNYPNSTYPYVYPIVGF